jgi:hypothetical protein
MVGSSIILRRSSSVLVLFLGFFMAATKTLLSIKKVRILLLDLPVEFLFDFSDNGVNVPASEFPLKPASNLVNVKPLKYELALAPFQK